MKNSYEQHTQLNKFKNSSLSLLKVYLVGLCALSISLDIMLKEQNSVVLFAIQDSEFVYSIHHHAHMIDVRTQIAAHWPSLTTQPTKQP